MSISVDGVTRYHKDKSAFIVNTLNLPNAVHEASIHTGSCAHKIFILKRIVESAKLLLYHYKVHICRIHIV